MREKKWYQICFLIVICISFNYVFRLFASALQLPIWMDSIGTVLSAYMFGPVIGAMVGAASNIVFSLQNSSSLYYIGINVIIGFVVGRYARKGYLENKYKTMTVCTIITVIATSVSTVINCVLFDGYIGNPWGDGIFDMLNNYGILKEISSFIAAFFVEFLDKVLCMMFLYFIIKAIRRIRISGNKAPKIEKKQKNTLPLFIFIAAITIYMISPVSASASEDECIDYSTYIRTVYSNDNGLTCGEANDIESTKDGIIWIGTYAGLFRYSGSEFRMMNEFSSVKNVNCLYVDDEGRLWIGTNDDGVSISIDEKITNTFDEEQGFPSNSVRCIVQCADKNYYIGTSGALAIVSLDGQSRTIKSFPEIIYATHVSADTKGNVVALTSTGELFLLRDDEIQASISHPENGYFTSCSFLKDGSLSVGTDSGDVFIYKINNSSFVMEKRIHDDELPMVKSINQLEDGSVFLCADSRIAWIDVKEEIHYLTMDGFDSSIDQMTEDYQGNLWFTSSRLGTMKLCPSIFTEIYPKYGLESSVVNAVTKWNNQFLFGSDSGLDIIDVTKNTIIENNLTELLAGHRIRCMIVDSNNKLWISAYGVGTVCAESETDYMIFNSENGMLGTKPRFILELSDGSFAISSELGITMIQDGRVVSTIGIEQGLTNSLVLCMAERQDGTILAGTDGGGICIIEKGTVVQVLDRNSGLSSSVILRFVEDKDNGQFFIVTSNGINYLEANDRIRQLNSFPYSNNYDILDKGDGKLYVTGSAGIYIVEKDALVNDSVEYAENYSYVNGLRDSFTANAINYLDTDDTWYIASGNGATSVNLKKYQTAVRQDYRVLLKSVKTDDEVLYLENKKRILIPSSTVQLEIKPEIINYSAVEPYIAYYIKDIDENNKTILPLSDLETIVYSGLSSGTHKFHLQILDAPNGKILEDIVYTIEKEAEIYDHLWFKICFFSELALIIGWFTWFFTRKWTERTLELQRKEIALAKEQVRMGNETIFAIAKTVDAKDGNTSQHSQRVSDYSCLIAQKLGYSEEDLANLRKIALLHDIGKIGIPDRILNKPAPLEDSEYEVMKSHVVIGGKILQELTIIPHVQEGALYHHERYDGKGYVHGLKGKEIPEIARIIGIADAFDAMTANRVYRNHLSFDIVLTELKKNRGKQFDPDLLDVFLELIDSGVITEEKIYKGDIFGYDRKRML